MRDAIGSTPRCCAASQPTPAPTAAARSLARPPLHRPPPPRMQPRPRTQAAMADAAPKSALELERQARIAKNAKRMQELGVVEAQEQLAAGSRAAAAAAARAAKPARREFERVVVPPECLRRTSRWAGAAEGAWGRSLRARARPRQAPAAVSSDASCPYLL